MVPKIYYFHDNSCTAASEFSEKDAAEETAVVAERVHKLGKTMIIEHCCRTKFEPSYSFRHVPNPLFLTRRFHNKDEYVFRRLKKVRLVAADINIY